MSARIASRSALWSLALVLLAAQRSYAQRAETGFLDRSVVIGTQTYPYQVYLPSDYSTRTDWPVILFLHGAGEGGRDGLLQTSVGLPAALRQNSKRFPALVVIPQMPLDSQWVGQPAEAAFAALTNTLSEFKVDRQRVYLTGLSRGGHGTWYLAYRHPEIFAAIAPVCGWVTERPDSRGSVTVIPPGDGPEFPALVKRLGKLPIWIFHGEMDPTVPVRYSREPADALKAASANVRYTEYLGLGHNVWDATYASDEFLKWLFTQRRTKP